MPGGRAGDRPEARARAAAAGFCCDDDRDRIQRPSSSGGGRELVGLLHADDNPRGVCRCGLPVESNSGHQPLSPPADCCHWVLDAAHLLNQVWPMVDLLVQPGALAASAGHPSLVTHADHFALHCSTVLCTFTTTMAKMGADDCSRCQSGSPCCYAEGWRTTTTPLPGWFSSRSWQAPRMASAATADTVVRLHSSIHTRWGRILCSFEIGESVSVVSIDSSIVNGQAGRSPGGRS